LAEKNIRNCVGAGCKNKPKPKNPSKGKAKARTLAVKKIYHTLM
jgi:hypothetical protein